MQNILETERLRLREFTLDDTSFIVALLNSPGWIEFIGDRHVRTVAQAAQYLENGPLKSYRQYGFGLWMVEKKEVRAPVGMCGIIKRDTLEHPDLGFAFLPEFHGHGYACEIARATLQHARTALGFAVISAITLPGNTRSVRLLEKTGFTFQRRLCFPGSEEELLLFTA
jgi:RimJ/RimL family protein N-acetyltransferase